MRVAVFANNRVGLEALRWLKGGSDEVVALILHPEARAKHADEIRATCPDALHLDASRLAEADTIAALRATKPEIGASLYFGYILKAPTLSLFPRGVVNLHPSLLPWNKGQYPNVWSIVERTPAGVTLHYIDEGIDTGDIIARREVPVLPHDTGLTLYRRLEDAALDLFRETWPMIRAGEAPRLPQSGGGSYHRTRDVERIDEIDLDRQYTARDLIDILRARTFPPYRGAFFKAQGRKVYVRIELLPEEERGGDRS